jgi:hypothetical protein
MAVVRESARTARQDPTTDLEAARRPCLFTLPRRRRSSSEVLLHALRAVAWVVAAVASSGAASIVHTRARPRSKNSASVSVCGAVSARSSSPHRSLTYASRLVIERYAPSSLRASRAATDETIGLIKSQCSPSDVKNAWARVRASPLMVSSSVNHADDTRSEPSRALSADVKPLRSSKDESRESSRTVQRSRKPLDRRGESLRQYRRRRAVAFAT